MGPNGAGVMQPAWGQTSTAISLDLTQTKWTSDANSESGTICHSFLFMHSTLRDQSAPPPARKPSLLLRPVCARFRHLREDLQTRDGTELQTLPRRQSPPLADDLVPIRQPRRSFETQQTQSFCFLRVKVEPDERLVAVRHDG